MTEQATSPDPIDVSRAHAERLCRHLEAVARHCRGDRHTPDERTEALELTATQPAAIDRAVRSALASREQVADVAVFLPFVRLSREVSSPDGQVGTVRASFRFDGDLVLLRGFGQAASDLAAKVSQARHEGLTVR